MCALYPNAACIDSVRRVLMDEAIMHIAVNDEDPDTDAEPKDDHVDHELSSSFFFALGLRNFFDAR